MAHGDPVPLDLFDLDSEVVLILDRVPALRADTVFLSARDSWNPDDPLNLRRHADFARDLDLLAADRMMQHFLHGDIKMAAKCGCSWASERKLKDGTSLRTLTFNPDDGIVRAMKPEHRFMAQVFVLAHEAGHFAVVGAQGDNDLFNERAADAFAAIMLLQRFGDAALECLQDIADFRRNMAKDPMHANYRTADVLALVIDDYKSGKLDMANHSLAAAGYAREPMSENATASVKTMPRKGQAAPVP